MTSPTLASIYRYPVKGLSPEEMPAVMLRPGETLPSDRRYAIENGDSKFDPANPVWRAKTYYLMLMRNERLAALRTLFEDATTTLTVQRHGTMAAQGDLETSAGRKAIEDFFAGYCADELRGPPRVLSSPGYSFSDVPMKVVSIINLASVAAVETMAGTPVHPLRFRGNLHVSGWPAWREFELLGQTLTIGGVTLKVTKRIVRCAATNVDPDTGIRDLTIPATLERRLGHADCGIYAEVIGGGEMAAGDEVKIN